MPIYEYECIECGHRLEAMQKLADAPLTECPDCHKSALKKLISAVGFRLSGSGWYETDFKSDNRRNLAEKDTGKGKENGAGAASANGGKPSEKTSNATSDAKATKSSPPKTANTSSSCA